MTQIFGPSNPLTYALFHSRGGVRGHLIYAGVATLVVSTILALTVQYSGSSWRQALAMWAQVLLIITPSIVGLTGMIGVSTAVKSDLTSGMVDSLRLMRVSPAVIIAGYILGGLTNGIAIAVPCIIGGAIASHFGGVGAVPFLWAEILLLSSVGMFLVISAYLGQSVRFAAMPVVVAAVIMPLSAPLSAVLPPITLLAGPVAGKGALSLRSVDVDVRLALNVIAQALVAAVFFVAAMRRFRYPGHLAFRADLGLVLILLWSLFGTVTVFLWDALEPTMIGPGSLEIYHIVCMVTPICVLGLIPSMAGARISGENIRAAIDDAHAPAPMQPPQSPYPGIPIARFDHLPWWLWPVLTALIGSLPGLLVFYIQPMSGWLWEAIGVTFIVLLTTLVSLAALMRKLCTTELAMKWRGGIIGVTVMAFLFTGPVMQWVIALVNGFSADWNEMVHVAQFSPLGAIIMAWTVETNPQLNPLDHRVGVVAMVIAGAVLLSLCRVSARRPATAS